MEYHSDLERKEVLIHAITSNHGDMALRAVNQFQKAIWYSIFKVIILCI